MSRLLSYLMICVPILVEAQTPDTTIVRQVDSLITVSGNLIDERNFEKALEVIATAEILVIEKLGRESITYGNICFAYGNILEEKADFSEAEKWYIESIAIREKKLGKEHHDYAKTINNLAGVYMSMGIYEKAKPLYLESKVLNEKTLGKNHPDYARSLNNLAIYYHTNGEYASAEPFYIEAMKINENLVGTEYQGKVNNLVNLAALYVDLNKYTEAELLFLKALKVIEKVSGKKDQNYAWCLESLAGLYRTMNNYEKAESLYLEAKAINLIALGKEHLNYAITLNNLAALYVDMGYYEQAEFFNEEARKIFLNGLGKEHPNFVSCQNNLATLYVNIGNFEKAKPLILEVISMREKMLGKEHPEYAASLNNLAALYVNMDSFEKAEPLYLETKVIKEKVFGKLHSEYADILNNLAALYLNMGNYNKAESMHLEALGIREKLSGKENFDYAWSLNNLGELYKAMNKNDKAESIYLEAKDIYEKVLGREHPFYATCLKNLSDLYNDMGQYEKAEQFFIDLTYLNQLLLSKAIHHLSERELQNYLKQFSSSQSKTLSFTLHSDIKKMGQICFDNSLFYKGFLLQSASQIKNIALSNLNFYEEFQILKSYERYLAVEYAKPIIERKDLKEIELKANNLEKELTRKITGFGEAKRQVKWNEIKDNLLSGEAAIEFVHFTFGSNSSTIGAKISSVDSTIYAAILLKSKDTQPQFIPLFEESQLNKVLNDGNELRTIEFLSQVYSSRGAIPVGNNTLAGLYDLVWKPLEKYLKNVTTVYYSPSGLLHRFNFDAIPLDFQNILSDKYNLIRLASTRSLVVPDLTNVNGTNDAILYGGIEYEIDTTTIKFDSTVQLITNQTNNELSFEYANRSVPHRGDNWNFLPGTKNELEGIAKIFQKVKYKFKKFSGKNGTEESFKSIGVNNQSPRILHIATHGFFFPDTKNRHLSTDGNREVVSQQEQPIFKISDHPMIRSGLLLTGSNYAWKTGKPFKEGMEDGILTAYEISQMNLSNTELVVLSACETGLGDIQGNEGVYGLQRAFKIAGAKYLIMSLWQVPDKQTSLLMTTFYKKWLEEKMSIPDAFHAAQKQLRDGGLEPYYWAGFVLME